MNSNVYIMYIWSKLNQTIIYYTLHSIITYSLIYGCILKTVGQGEMPLRQSAVVVVTLDVLIECLEGVQSRLLYF